MKILFLAPQPFFQERGTPIAVRLALEVLSKRGTDEIDLLTYHEGEEIEIPSVRAHRIWAPKWLSGIGPGASVKKLLCDLIFLLFALRMAWRARRVQYAVVHAVEEAVFVALLLRLVFRIPYIYDMDSSLALQITEKWRILKIVSPILKFLERAAVRYSMAVVPVCDALAVIARGHGSRETHLLPDISLLDRGALGEAPVKLREEANIPESDLILVYIGNLERYQGIDLLIEAVAQPSLSLMHGTVVVVGGRPDHVSLYREKAEALGVADRFRFLGVRPVSSLNHYLSQADILLSPRIKGNNTPMKIYSYLHSGKLVVATRLPTHTQVMNDGNSLLADPTPEAFGRAIKEAMSSEKLRIERGDAARRLAEERYTFEVFSRQLNSIYERINQRLGLVEVSAKAA